MKQTLFLAIIILLLAVLIIMVAILPGRLAIFNGSSGDHLKSMQLEYANKLLSKGLKERAAEVLETYIAAASGDYKEEARLLYKVGSIYMDLYKYEKALENFYKAEIVDSKADFSQEMDQKIVEALENLGMNTQARYELESRTSLGEERQAQGKIVARIGKRQISDAEIDREIKVLPDWMKKELDDVLKRKEFIKDYVSREVLYAKAQRLGLDKKDDVRQSVDQIKKQIVVGQLLEKEIAGKLNNISPEDVKMYYDANKESLGVEPAQIKVSYLSFEKESQKDENLKRIKDPGAKLKEATISEGDSSISDIGDAKDAISGLFLREKGQVSDPLKIGDKFYIFSILDKKEKKYKSFEEVKSRAEYEYKAKKQQEEGRVLLKQALEEQEVQIY